MKNFRVI